jgi:hypothetical protein
MKVKIKSNKLQVGRSITVELLKPVRVNGRPTHKFVFSKTLTSKLWSFGELSNSAKKKLYEFWDYLEFHIADANPESRDRIIEQVETVIPRLTDEESRTIEAERKAKAEEKKAAEKAAETGIAKRRLIKQAGLDLKKGNITKEQYEKLVESYENPASVR